MILRTVYRATLRCEELEALRSGVRLRVTWELELICGHLVEEPVRRPPYGLGRVAAMLPSLKKRCEECERAAKKRAAELAEQPC